MESKLFPFGSHHDHDHEHWRDLVYFLPSYGRAMFLIDRYHVTFDSTVVAVPPSQTDEHIIPLFYPAEEPIQGRDLSKDSLHDLALLFAVLASGCTNDYSLPQRNAEAESYTHLSKAALSFHNIIQHASLSAVQTILILSSYTRTLGMSRRADKAWSLMSFGCQIAISVSQTASKTYRC